MKRLSSSARISLGFFLAGFAAMMAIHWIGPRLWMSPMARAKGLDVAIVNNDCPKVSLMLERVGGPNVHLASGETPLTLAVLYRKLDVVRLLLDRGADPNLSACGGAAPLWLAMGLREKDVRQEMFHLLRQAGARTPVMISWRYGLKPSGIPFRQPELNMLLNAGADVNIRDDSGTSPLMCAIEWGCQESAKALLKAGASEEIRSCYGKPTRWPLDVARWPAGLGRISIPGKESMSYEISAFCDCCDHTPTASGEHPLPSDPVFRDWLRKKGALPPEAPPRAASKNPVTRGRDGARPSTARPQTPPAAKK